MLPHSYNIRSRLVQSNVIVSSEKREIKLWNFITVWRHLLPATQIFQRRNSKFAFPIYFQLDEDVKELDKLKSKDGIDSTGKLEDSLKKLHDTNPHHKSHEEKPVKVANYSC